MSDIVKVIVCPKCGDSWITEDDNILKKECLCFRCGHKYIPDKIIKMWYFVYELLKRTKG